MADWNSIVYTDAGAALMTKSLAGKCQIEFTKVQSGDGTWNTDLKKATALKSMKQQFGITSVKIMNISTVALTSVISNENLKTAYQFREFGIFAREKGNSNTEILYAIITAKDYDLVPPYNSVTPQTITMEVYVAVANAEEVEIKVNMGAVALNDDLLALSKRVDDLYVDSEYRIANENGIPVIRHYKATE